jgi:hypothetical protein
MKRKMGIGHSYPYQNFEALMIWFMEEIKEIRQANLSIFHCATQMCVSKGGQKRVF